MPFVYKQSIHFSKIFSSRLQEACKEKKVLFIDVKKYIIDEEGNIDDKYCADPIHASQEILPHIEKCFSDIAIPIEIKLQKKQNLKQIKSNFKYDKRFDCYVA